jgi:hypothetical protein
VAAARNKKTKPKGRGPGANAKKPPPQTTGERAAVAIALTATGNAPPTEQIEEQLDIEDLIGAPQLREDQVAVLNANGPRGVGRPPGARNKRVTEWAEYLLTRYASPLEVLAQMAVARVDELAARIGCTKLEAYQEKRLAAIALVPYIHQKQPLAVNLSNKTFVHLTITEEGASAATPDDITVVARVVERIDGANT